MRFCDRCGALNKRTGKKSQYCCHCEEFLRKARPSAAILKEIKRHPQKKTKAAIGKQMRSTVRVHLDGRLGFTNPGAMAEFVRKTLLEREEIRTQHGPVKHWKRNAAGELVLVEP